MSVCARLGFKRDTLAPKNDLHLEKSRTKCAGKRIPYFAQFMSHFEKKEGNSNQNVALYHKNAKNKHFSLLSTLRKERDLF